MVSQKAKKFMFGTAVFGLLFGSPSNSRGENGEQNRKSEKTETPVQKVKHKSDVTKKYKITTREDFDLLYADAEPFIFTAMIPTENWRLDFHNDRQKKNATPNSVGVGLYYVGVKNGSLDFSSKTWKLTKSYVINYQNSHKGKNPPNLKSSQLYEGTIGWFRNMESGRHLNELFQHLKGAQLTIHEFAAIASVYYNDEAIGRSVCDYVKNNYANPKKCAHFIIKTAAKMNGIKPRRVHEVLVYLNYQDYCSNVFSLEVDGRRGTSVSDITEHYNALKKEITNAKLSKASHTIYTRVVKGGHPIRYYIQTMDSRYKNPVLAFETKTEQSIEMDRRGMLYEQAIEKYNAKDYEGALVLFKQIVAENGNSADLYNDMAITYYHLGKYAECIEQCRKTLKTDEREKYMYATYNTGLAYWKLQDYDSAIKNLNAAVKYSKEFGKTDNQKIYESKLSKCKKAKEAAQPKSKDKKSKANINKQNLKKGTRKVQAMIKIDEQRRKKTGHWEQKQYS